MKNPLDDPLAWLIWNLRGRPRIQISEELRQTWARIGVSAPDSVPLYKYSEIMRELDRRAWENLERRVLTPEPLTGQVEQAGQKSLKGIALPAPLSAMANGK